MGSDDLETIRSVFQLYIWSLATLNISSTLGSFISSMTGSMRLRRDVKPPLSSADSMVRLSSVRFQSLVSSGTPISTPYVASSDF